MNRRRVGFTLALGLLAVLLALMLSRLERYEEVVDHGPSPAAQADPYLAADRFLAESGLAVERARLSDAVVRQSPANHTLLLLGERADMTAAQSERLLDWTARGGHLVFVAEQLWDEASGRSGDLLLDGLGLQQHEVETRRTSEAEPRSSEPGPELTRLYIEEQSAPAYLAFDVRFHLYDPNGRAHAWANSAGATHMLQLRHGEGLVTVLTDAWIWQNDRIGQYDHAWLLWYLTQDTQVTMVTERSSASLLALLARHYPLSLAVLGLALILSLWHFGWREGPIRDSAQPARRSLAEHLRATAAFLLRNGASAELIQPLQADIDRRATRHRPGYGQLSADERLALLAELSGLPSDTVRIAMRPAAGKSSPIEFTQQVAHLQSLRNAL